MNLNRLFERVKNILVTPKTEWPVIAGEPATAGDIYTGYVLILAAVPAVFGLIDATVLGYSVPFAGTIRLGVGAALSAAVLSYVLSIVAVFVMSLIVNALAPTFGGEKNSVQALKAVAYASTASWIAGIGTIVPFLSFFIMLAGVVYCVYLLYLGLPQTMKSPPEKAAGYTAVSIIIAIVLGWIINLVVAGVMGTAMLKTGSIFGGRVGDVSESVKIDPASPLGKLEKWGEQMEQAAGQMEEAQKSGDQKAQTDAFGALLGTALGGKGNVESLAPDRLKTFLPETLVGLPRTNIEVSRNNAMGMQISVGNATYGAAEGPQIRVEITDMGGAQGMMMLASWATIETESETDTGYEKTFRDGDRMVHEQWDHSNTSGEYAVILGERFVAKASGNVDSVDQLKTAIGALDLGALEALKGEGVKPN